MRRSGVVDYLSWSQRLKLEDIPLLVKHCRTAGPLTQSALTELELQLLHNMLGRLQKLAEVASEVPPPLPPRPALISHLKAGFGPLFRYTSTIICTRRTRLRANRAVLPRLGRAAAPGSLVSPAAPAMPH